MNEDVSRFWTAVFGLVSALSDIFGIGYSVKQFRDAQQRDEKNLQVQVANAQIDSQKPFLQRQLELCEEAASDAAILATHDVQSTTDVDKARGDFWGLYWGPLGIVENSGMRTASKAEWWNSKPVSKISGVLRRLSI